MLPTPVSFRDPRNGRPTVAKSCPSCSRRFAGVVDDDCIRKSSASPLTACTTSRKQARLRVPKMPEIEG